MAKLAILKSFTLPMAEVSSLALRAVGSQRELCAVGDESSCIVIASLGDQGEITSVRTIDVRSLIAEEACGEWEGLAADGAGNLYVLQERGRLIAFNAQVDTLLGVLELPTHEGNSGAEGVLLLRNGHLLVLQEKRPARLVEVGPRGAASSGIHAGLFEPESFPWPTPDTVFEELQSWSVELEDISDVAVRDGRLFLVSDASKCIAEIESTLPAEGGEARVLERWKLDKETKKAEGLVMLGSTPMVASDKLEGEPNLFWLEQLG
jgi:uncharacterized protein YjiK